MAPTDPRKWKYRRRAVYGTLVCSIVGIAVLGWMGGDSIVRKAAIDGFTMLSTLVLTTYVLAPSLEEGWLFHTKKGEK